MGSGERPGAPDDAHLESLAARHTRAFEARAAEGDEDQDDPARIPLEPPYEDAGQVARGGMGLLRRAYDPELQRHVAVKVIRPSLAADPSVVKRFVQEARITGGLDHPNVVPVHKLARGPADAPNLVMKLIEGRTLTEHLALLPVSPWPPALLDETLEILLKVCDAVAFAHSRGIIHRDIKPDNIMVGAFGQVYVMDWGIARVLPREGSPAGPATAEEDPEEAPIGTPAYMTPEQALRNEDAIDQRTDVYLLGAVLYEILTSQRPHGGPTLLAVLYHAIAGDIVPPEEAAPRRQPPAPLARIAMKAMSRDPADRYQTVLEFKRDIESFLRGEERAPTQTFAAGERVLVEGQSASAAYVIVSGRCIVYKEQDGQRHVLRELGHGEVFGETSVFTASPVSATVEAVEPTMVKLVTRESLAEGLGLNTWLGAFVQTLARRFREVDERLREMEQRHP